MTVEETYLKGCFVITPTIFEDERGGFFEAFNLKSFKEHTGLDTNFVQDNQSVSKKGVLRGLHFQTGVFAQAKLVRVVQGKALDVCVDLRKESPTFGQHFSIILEAKNNKELYIPRGFAHGFLAMEKDTVFSYKCDNYYSKNHERGIIYNDKTFNIDWGITDDQVIISEKDKKLPTFEDYFK